MNTRRGKASSPCVSSPLIMALDYHKITIGNAVFGKARLLDIGLPEGWQLAPGVSHPEVMATHTRAGHMWVVAGNAWYVVYRPDEGWALEVAIHIRAASDKDSLPAPRQHWVQGHPAAVTWKTRRRGLPWRRHDVTFMTLTFLCPRTERRIVLEFSGWCPPDGFQQILEATQYWHCH